MGKASSTMLSAFWERGSPDLPACGVARGGAQHGPSSSTQTQDPREGSSLAGRTTQSFLRHGLIRLARKEAERSRRGTSQAMTTEARRAPACGESLFPLWCKGGKRGQGYQAKATIPVQQDQDQQNGGMEVIVVPKCHIPSPGMH